MFVNYDIWLLRLLKCVESSYLYRFLFVTFELVEIERLETALADEYQTILLQYRQHFEGFVIPNLTAVVSSATSDCHYS